MDAIVSGNLARKAAAMLLSGAVAATSAAVPAAFAEQTGSGETSLVLHLAASGEYGGSDATGEFANPDADGDGLGDNLAFTVPTRVDFSVASDGTLTGPSPAAVYLENESQYPVHVSSMAIQSLAPWTLVADATVSPTANSLSLNVGPHADRLSAVDYLAKSPVSKPSAWNMAARASEGTADRVELEFSGAIANTGLDLVEEVAFGKINWYVTPGVGKDA